MNGNGNGKPRYKKSVSMDNIFPGLGASTESSQELHNAIKFYTKNGDAESLAQFLESSGFYTWDTVVSFVDGYSPPAQKPKNPARYNGHRGGVYPKDGKK